MNKAPYPCWMTGDAKGDTCTMRINSSMHLLNSAPCIIDMGTCFIHSHFNDNNRVLVSATDRFADVAAYNASEQNQLTRATNGGTATGRALNRTFGSLPADFAARPTKALVILTDGLSLETCARVGGLVTSPLSTDDGNCIARASARWSDAGWKVCRYIYANFIRKLECIFVVANRWFESANMIFQNG